MADIEELRKELRDLAEKLGRRAGIESRLTSVKAQEKELMDKEYEVKKILQKEQEDVERLEKTSATSIFFAILGQKEKKLDKEQQEAFAAKLKYDTLVGQLEDCKSQKEALILEKQSLASCDNKYRETYEAIQKELRMDPVFAEKLCEAEKQCSEIRNQLREVAEAEAAGKACLGQINSIEKSLGSAEGWGTWDVLGGGLLSDMAKHSHLDEAQDGANRLQTYLGRFRTELADVKINEQMGQVNIDGFLRFADYFFDGLIADWSVLSRIHDSQKSVGKVKSQVTTALQRLDNVKRMYEQRKRELEQQLDAMVRNA